MSMFIEYLIIVLVVAYIFVFPKHLFSMCGTVYGFCKKHTRKQKQKEKKGDSLRSVTTFRDGVVETTFYGEDAPPLVHGSYMSGAACTCIYIPRPEIEDGNLLKSPYDVRRDMFFHGEETE